MFNRRMDVIFKIEHTEWDAPFDEATQAAAVDALENGSVLFFPRLAFVLADYEN